MSHPQFLPVNQQEAALRGWESVDFVFVTGDAYVDHPSFGPALLSRVLEARGFRVGILPQPDVKDPASFLALGQPRLAFLVSGGVVDSMVAHYTVARRRREKDEYSPGGKPGLRPDRAVDTYTRTLRKLYPGVPVIIGGVEASLRRFAHYDYWSNTVRPSILESSGADLLSFGMGERSLCEVARRLDRGEAIEAIREVPGTAFLGGFWEVPRPYAECGSFRKVSDDKRAYAKACRIQMDNQDPAAALPVVQKQSQHYLVQNLPAQPLSREELDALYALPFTRRWHPMYDEAGGVPALEEVEFSIAQGRGCFGGCNFCAITLHQGRRVTSRSEESVLEEAVLLTKQPGFKGYIHDIGGPTANFRAPSCQKQLQNGVCKGAKRCLAPSPCSALEVDHSEYLSILRKVRALPGVKKVFIRSGIRFDYLVHDRDERFFKELVQHHVSGQLKVAPEHCAPRVLKAMGKPPVEVYDRFAKRFAALSEQAGKKQYLVPYLMSSHPGSTLADAVTLAAWLRRHRVRPQQVQDFYPTPGTVSTCMYHTGLDPYTLEPIYVAKEGEDKALQRALLQYHLPKNAPKVRKALLATGRQDLIPLLLPGDKKPAQAGQKPPSGPKKKPMRPRPTRNGIRTPQGDPNAPTSRQKERRKAKKRPR